MESKDIKKSQNNDIYLWIILFMALLPRKTDNVLENNISYLMGKVEVLEKMLPKK